MSHDVHCGSCGAVNGSTHAFCSACGIALEAAAELTPAPAPAPGPVARRRGYRGPKVVLISGFVLLVLGGTASAAAFASVQASGEVGFALDLGAPALNTALEWIGAEQVKAPEGENRETSLAVIGIFILGMVVAALGALLALWGTIWLALRWSPQGRRHAEAARPRLEAAAERGRRTFDEELRPRGQELLRKSGPTVRDAASRGRERIAKAAAARRDRPPEP